MVNHGVTKINTDIYKNNNKNKYKNKNTDILKAHSQV